MIYLDNAATTYPKPDSVYTNMINIMKTTGMSVGRGNSKEVLDLNKIVYNARKNISSFFGIKNPRQLIFTSGCTESLNLAIKGILNKGDHVITTETEHNSVIRPLYKMNNISTTLVKFTNFGKIDPLDIKKNIKKNTKLVIVNHVSNVTGIKQDIKAIGNICKNENIFLLVDASQSAGVNKIDVNKDNIDMLAFPGHKSLYGPQGIGGLYIREGINLDTLIEGGTGSNSEFLEQPKKLPDRYESGTINTPGIIGLNSGIDFIRDKGIENINIKIKELTKYFMENAKKIDKLKLYALDEEDYYNGVISLNLANLDSTEVSYILDSKYGIKTRSGIHCNPVMHNSLGTIKQGTVRFSFSYFTNKKDIDLAINGLRSISKEL